MNIRHLLSNASIVLIMGLTSCLKCDPYETDVLNNTDKEYMIGLHMASTSGMMLGKLAIQEAENPAIKSYADYIVQSHHSIRDELKTLASNVGFSLPDSVTDLRQQLSGLQGRSFDSAYIHDQSFRHRATLASFLNEQSRGQHEDVKMFSYRFISHVQTQLRRADSLATHLYTKK